MCDRTGQDMIVISPAARENTQSCLSLHTYTHTQALSLTHMRTLRFSYSHTCIYSHSCTHVHTPTHTTCAVTHIHLHSYTCILTRIHAFSPINSHSYICAHSIHIIQELTPVRELRRCPAAFIHRVLPHPSGNPPPSASQAEHP